MDDANDSLRAAEAECAKGRTAPRVSLDDIEANITMVIYKTGEEITEDIPGSMAHLAPSIQSLTVAIAVLRNGFTVIGKSAPASPANFDPVLGRKLAYEDVVRQCWPLMGYALREKLA